MEYGLFDPKWEYFIEILPIRNNFWQTIPREKNSDTWNDWKFQLTKCTSGNCGKIPPIIAYFRQGGNNIESMFVELQDYPDYTPQWNILFGIVNSIYTPASYGEGDEQVVVSEWRPPYGYNVYELW